MIELLDAFHAEGVDAAIVRVEIDGEFHKLKFKVSLRDLKLLRNILGFRPFENTSVGEYRYFFDLSYRDVPGEEGMHFTSVRVEQNEMHKQFEFKISEQFLANLLWFQRLESLEQVVELIVQ